MQRLITFHFIGNVLELNTPTNYRCENDIVLTVAFVKKFLTFGANYSKQMQNFLKHLKHCKKQNFKVQC